MITITKVIYLAFELFSEWLGELLGKARSICPSLRMRVEHRQRTGKFCYMRS